MALLTRSGRNPSQDQHELAAFIGLLQANGVRRYLEIGARHGDTFYEVMRHLPSGSTGVAIDLPGGPWGKSSSARDLQNAVDELYAQGFDVHYLLADSQKPRTRASALALSPTYDRYAFDAILIDGDHRYEGVARDWQLYGDLAPIVAFHDIAGEGQTTRDKRALPVEVPRLWAQLRQLPEVAGETLVFHEFISHGSKMGIGVVCRS